VPILTVGLDAEPRRIVDLAPARARALRRRAPGLRRCRLTGRTMVARQLARGTSPTNACSRRWSASRASCSCRTRSATTPTPTRRCRSATARRSRSRTWWRGSRRRSRCGRASACSTSGTGSGYQAAVLAELGTEVVTIERIPELAERARASLAAGGLPAGRRARRRRNARRFPSCSVRRDRGRRRGARLPGDALRAAAPARPARRSGRRRAHAAPRGDRPAARKARPWCTPFHADSCRWSAGRGSGINGTTLRADW
jgi:hypothetical protein